MDNGLARLGVIILLCSAVSIFSVVMTVQAKIPEGYRDIKLGMNKNQVLEVLQKSPIHFAFDDNGPEIGEIIRGDELFRYASYKFDNDGVLIEIGLQMREILGRDKCIEMFNSQNGTKISPPSSTTEADVSIEVKDNSLVMKKKTGKESRAAAAGM